MMKLISLLLFIFTGTALLSCSDEETYTQVQMYKLARAADPDSTAVLGDLADTTRDLCSEMKYGQGCMKVIRAEILKLQVIFIKFESTKFARLEAKRIDQFYARNWVIDDVSGEPTLERFMREVYKAKRPIIDENPTKKNKQNNKKKDKNS